jgi:hypothetical protein
MKRDMLAQIIWDACDGEDFTREDWEAALDIVFPRRSC